MEPRDLFIRFKGDTSDAEAALNRVNQGLKQSEEAAKKADDAHRKLGETLSKPAPPPPPPTPTTQPLLSGGFDKIAGIFEQVSKAGNLTTKDINAAASALGNLQKAGLSSLNGLGDVASRLETLSKTGKLSGEEVQKLQATFTQLSNAGVKSGDDLSKLAAVFNALGTKQKETTTTSQELTSSSVAMAAALGSTVGNAVVALAAKFAQLLPEMLKAGETATNINDSFVRLEGGTVIAEQALAKLRTATQGLVSDLDIKQTVNQGLLLGLDPGKMDKLAAAATRLGQAVGRDATSALNDLILGLSRGSPRILDNLGIVVKAEEAYKKYAAANHLLVSELTEAEKKVAIQNEAVEQADKKVTELGPPLQNAATEFHRLGTEISNASTDMSIAAANSDTLKVVFHQLTDSVAGLSALFRVLFSDDLDSNIVRAQIRIEQLSEKIKKAKDAANNNVPSGSVGEYLGFLFDFSTVPSPGAGGPTFSNADQQELQKLRAEQARDKSKKQYQTIEADIAAAFREIEAKDRFKAEQDEERRRIKAAADSKKAAKEAENALESLEKKRDAIFAKSQQQEDLLGLQKAINSADGAGIEEFAKKVNQATSDQLYAGLKDTLAKAGLSRESKQFGEILAATINENASKAINAVTQDIAKNQQQLAAQSLQFQLEDALKKNNLAAVQDLQTQIENADWKSAYNASLKQQLDNNVAVFQAYFLAGKDADAKLALEHQRNARQLEELQKQAFQNSVSFFQDLLSSAIDGTGKDLEETMLEALKKVGVGFASQMAASIFSGIPGLSNLSQIGSAQGLGQAIAASFFPGGGVKPLGGYFGGGAGVGGGVGGLFSSLLGGGSSTGSVIGQNLDGSYIYGPSTGGLGGFLGAAPGSSFGFPQYAAAALAAITAQQSISGIQSIINGNHLSLGAQAALALPTFGASFLYNPISDLVGGFFGADSQASKDRLAREGLISSFKEKFGTDSFNTVGGSYTLNKNDYNTDGLSNTSVGLSKPLAEIFSGGNGKLAEDLTGIFAHGIGDAKNFNEELLNTASLLTTMGTNAKDAEGVLFKLFKEGKISQNEFADGLRDLETVAQDTFQGENGIAEGFKAIEELLGNGTNQGLVGAVQGLSTEMNTFAKQGLKTTKEVADYFAKAGDTLHAKFFQLLSDQGYKTADDLKNALNDPNLFNQLLTDLQNAGDLSAGLGAAQGDAGAAGSNAQRALQSETAATTKEIDKQREAVEKLIGAYDRLHGQNGGGSGGGSNPGPTQDENDGGGTPASTPNPTGRTRSRIVNPRRPTGL